MSHCRIVKKLKTELGPLIISALEDPVVIEVMVNADGTIWTDSLGKGIERFQDSTPISPIARESVIATLATLNNTTVTATKPRLSCILPFNGERFQGQMPPIVSAPMFSIRKKAERVIPLSDYLKDGNITEPQSTFLKNLITQRANILVAGSTSSGKTTFINALLAEVVETHPQHRVVLIEDTPELQCAAANYVQMKTVDGCVSMQDLLRDTLRLRPDRIIVGEVRGGEAFTYLKALNTGHPGGLCSIHANSAKDALLRLEQCISEVIHTPQQVLVASAIDCVLFMSMRRLEEIVMVRGIASDSSYLTESITTITKRE